MIVLETYCGLCNRLRAIQASLDLAEKYGHQVLVVWDKNENCCCTYENLFQKTDRFRLLTTQKKDYVSKIRREYWRRKARKTGSFLSQEQMDAEKLWDAGLEKKYADVLKDPKQVLYVVTWDLYFHSEKSPYDWLKPQPDLDAEIQTYRDAVGENGIGLHIRRTDHKDAILQSPTELFVDAMHRELAQNPQVRFYVATDDAAEKKNLRSIFGDRIISKKEQNLQRDTVEGMKDTVLDVYCLAHTRRIYGSFRSSFSEEAARLGGCELITLKKTE